MHNFPQATLLSKQLPKVQVYKELGFKPEERRLVDADVGRLDFVAQFTPETLPALMHGKKVSAVYVLRLELKRETWQEDTLRLLARIPQALLFALAFGGKVRFALVFEKRVFMTEAVPEEAATLKLQGADFDLLWLHLVADVAGLAPGNEDSLRFQIGRREQRQKLEAELASTEKKMWGELQPHKRNELFERCQRLRQELAELG